MKPSYFLVLYLVLAFILSSCSTGSMTVRETHYYAVTNGVETNFYRLKIEANTYLGDASYRSGWFPSAAVDNLYGDVSDSGSTKALKNRREIEDEVRKAVLHTYKAWLNEAKKPSADMDKLQNFMEARRRVLAYPSFSEPFPGAFEIEYNPAKGVAMRHADEKMVFVLSSNPDLVVGEISNFAQSQESALAVQKLGSILQQRSTTEVIEQSEKNSINVHVMDVIANQMKASSESISEDTNKESAIRHIDSLLVLLRTLE